MEITQEQKLLQQVVNEAWENADFKEKLIKNPLVAIEALTGEKLNIPEGKTFVVRDQSSESIVYINIPAPKMKEDAELTEDQLELVAGGSGPGLKCWEDPNDDNSSDNNPFNLLTILG